MAHALGQLHLSQVLERSQAQLLLDQSPAQAQSQVQLLVDQSPEPERSQVLSPVDVLHVWRITHSPPVLIDPLRVHVVDRPALTTCHVQAVVAVVRVALDQVSVLVANPVQVAQAQSRGLPPAVDPAVALSVKAVDVVHRQQ